MKKKDTKGRDFLIKNGTVVLLLQVYMPLFTLTVAQAEWRHEMFKTAESIDTGASVRVVCKKILNTIS